MTYKKMDTKVGKELEKHEYFNPNFLNVNRYHGVRNDTDEERMIPIHHLLFLGKNLWMHMKAKVC